MTEYVSCMLEWYWSYVKKYYELFAAKFIITEMKVSLFWVTDEIQAVQDRLLCVKLVTSR